MAEPAVLDLYIHQGDTYRRQFTIWADATKTAAVDITGWSFLAQLRIGAADDNPTPAATFDTFMVDAASGIFEMVLYPEDSLTLDPEVLHYWDLQVTTAASDVLTLMTGQVTVGAEFSR